MIFEGRQWTRRHPRVTDAALALSLCGLTALAGAMSRPPEVTGPPPVAVCAVVAVSAAALLAHRRRPRTAVAVTTACVIAVGALHGSPDADFSPLAACTTLAALYSLALRTDRRTAVVHTAAAAAALLVASVVWGGGGAGGDAGGFLLRPEQVGLLGFVLLSAAVADSARNRRDYVAAVEARAELAERTREDEARLRVSEERMRIARDLHDVVAHHIALARIQAGTARYLLRERPDRAAQVIGHLDDTTAAAMREIRATVRLLRRADDPDEPLRPAPCLAALPALLTAFGHAGLTVSLDRRGTARPLPPGVELTAYRVVQEALTNVSKHAGTASAAVRVHYGGRLLTLTVTDDGGGPPRSPGAGYGLIGMRERARSAGGRPRAGPRPGGGFEVHLELPCPAGHGPDTATAGEAAPGNDDARAERP
ncbi:sensor histidine kinase [Streptomyces sp. NPDC091281]|uniref:sensor histidine kinase n=1 Tax=Streptomyces sp. NPDC091281 TaxID=3365985 RepID=UPI0037FB4DCB